MWEECCKRAAQRVMAVLHKRNSEPALFLLVSMKQLPKRDKPAAARARAAELRDVDIKQSREDTGRAKAASEAGTVRPPVPSEVGTNVEE